MEVVDGLQLMGEFHVVARIERIEQRVEWKDRAPGMHRQMPPENSEGIGAATRTRHHWLRDRCVWFYGELQSGQRWRLCHLSSIGMIISGGALSMN